MKGQIIVEKETGLRWVYVPEAHIQFRASNGGEFGLILVPFRTDGFYQTDQGLVPTLDWLKETCQFTTMVEIPDEIVTYAVESERRRQDSIAAMIDGATEAYKESSCGDVFSRDDLIHELLTSDRGQLEHSYATKVVTLLSDSRGLQ